MNAVKRLLATCFVLLTMTTAWARDVKVWPNPAIDNALFIFNGDGYFNPSLELTKVELTKDETMVHMTLILRSDSDFPPVFSASMYLQAGDKQYLLRSAEGIELDKPCRSVNDEFKAVFHFEPLPMETKAFDLCRDSVALIGGIKPVEECWSQLFPSYWRNEKTGNWEIAFLDDCAIYQCRFWSYAQKDVDAKSGKAEMVLRADNGEELRVSVGRNKKGRRTMQIGDKKSTCSMLTGRYLPPYPTQDTRTDFVDNGYKTDTVTVVGWVKDMPDMHKGKKTFEFIFTDMITDEQTITSASLDEQGRFTARVPVVNTTEFLCDWRRCYIRTVLEPGKTYFMLYDFKTGRRYFMGDDVRLQNELFKYTPGWDAVSMDDGEDFNHYITRVNDLLQTQYARIDSLCTANSSLSARFKTFRKGNTLFQQAQEFGQARFYTENRALPENASQYAYDTFWTKLPNPVTLHYNTSAFLTDYLGSLKCAANPSGIYVYKYNRLDHIDELASDEKELEVLRRWSTFIYERLPKVEAATTKEEKMRVQEEENAKNAELISEAMKIMDSPRAERVEHGYMLIEELHEQLHLLDSLKAEPMVKDISISRKVYGNMESNCRSIAPFAMDTIRALVKTPFCIDAVEKRNEYLLALENREFDRLVLKSNEDVAGLTEGQEQLQKILEPYKGHLVLLDVWGTWCGPCKLALSHSTEEYARLDKYNIVYLYLANNSPQKAWENVIKMYNVSGDRVVHYNLPKDQQRVIEEYLKVMHFPTYKLFDKEGRLLDLDVDGRDLDVLERVIKQLSGQ